MVVGNIFSRIDWKDPFTDPCLLLTYLWRLEKINGWIWSWLKPFFHGWIKKELFNILLLKNVINRQSDIYVGYMDSVDIDVSQ